MEYNLSFFNKKEKIKIAGIVADLMGDGHLQKPPKNRFDYTSNNIQELERFEREIFSIFKIKGKIRECKTNPYISYNYGVNNKKVALFLGRIGVPRGNKVLSRFRIPGWILKDKKSFSRFIDRLFSCEACVDVEYKAIEIKMYKSLENIDDGIKFFYQIKSYLKRHFDIKTTKPFLTKECNIRKDGVITRGIRLKIKNDASLKKFSRWIGFENLNKKQKLNKVIDKI